MPTIVTSQQCDYRINVNIQLQMTLCQSNNIEHSMAVEINVYFFFFHRLCFYIYPIAELNCCWRHQELIAMIEYMKLLK